jgi:cold shock CspA family protein
MTDGLTTSLSFGIIVHYNFEKCFGFILLEDEKTTVFFHNTRQRDCCSRGSEPIPMDYWTVEAKKGEKVIVKIEQGPKGPRAEYWMKQSNWDAALQKIEDRGTIRMRHRTGKMPLSRLHPRPTYETLWQGTSLTELCIMRSKIFYRSFEEEFSACYFEQLQDDGTWLKIKDPR